ncbi:beta-hydroxyacyl-ACP dehydratase [Lactobacillus sp. CC-MHH1034]|uniref:3-hydroxyacyl-ACP dehydratase FabZ family protein n=1 Tax=Agrilactobacillus fermenti TaxID=2586909 RepID=UPI001E590E20|nr:3-hydroxyacyl-ACP dehydratase FabZ family protein [Agrilactobacillus fermenti]MCD2255711.1 beta-hydroxyacyl-ACP dehydratase [Agrilactobacillus fermenti]
MAKLSTTEITKLIPEQHEQLMVDQVLETDAQHIVAHQFISEDAPYFQGHFPSEPVVPGVLLVEGLQQSTRLFLKLEAPDLDVTLQALSRVKFRKTVAPGSELTYDVQLVERTTQTLTFKGIVFLADQKACQAKIIFAVKGGHPSVQ